MTNNARKRPINLDVQRHIREAHDLRGRYVSAVLRSLARSARSCVVKMAGIFASQIRGSVASQRSHAGPQQAEGDRS
jgi:hypothetical protein